MPLAPKTISLCFSSVCLYSAMIGCSDKRVFTDGENESKQPAMELGENNAFASDPIDKNFHGFYNFYVRRKGKEEIVCKGEAEIVSRRDGTVTTGKAICTDPLLKGAGVHEIEIEDDPNEVLVRLPWEETKAMGLDPRMTRLKSIGKTTYDPYLPNLLGPVIQDPSSFADLDNKTQVTVKTENKKGEQISATGNVHVKVLGAGIEYQPEGYFEKFDEVVHYHMNAIGFAELPSKSKVGLYEKFEYHWSTQPIAILNVHIEGPIKDFEESKFRGFAGNILFGGGIVIDLVLKEHVQVTN